MSIGKFLCKVLRLLGLIARKGAEILGQVIGILGAAVGSAVQSIREGLFGKGAFGKIATFLLIGLVLAALAWLAFGAMDKDKKDKRDKRKKEKAQKASSVTMKSAVPRLRERVASPLSKVNHAIVKGVEAYA